MHLLGPRSLGDVPRFFQCTTIRGTWKENRQTREILPKTRGLRAPFYSILSGLAIFFVC
jgi:hypothetical protein